MRSLSFAWKSNFRASLRFVCAWGQHAPHSKLRLWHFDDMNLKMKS